MVTPQPPRALFSSSAIDTFHQITPWRKTKKKAIMHTRRGLGFCVFFWGGAGGFSPISLPKGGRSHPDALPRPAMLFLVPCHQLLINHPRTRPVFCVGCRAHCERPPFAPHTCTAVLYMHRPLAIAAATPATTQAAAAGVCVDSLMPRVAWGLRLATCWQR